MMGWHSVDVAGKRMWEDPSGVRVESWEQIEAVNKSRELPPPRAYPEWYEDEIEENLEPINPVVSAIIFIMIIAVILYNIMR